MFTFVGGALCLDFVNTSSWNGEAEIKEWLTDAAALAGWARAAKLPEARAISEEGAPASLINDAKRLRLVLRRLLLPLAHGHEPSEAALRAFEREAKRTLSAAQLSPRSRETRESPHLALVWPDDAPGCGVLERVTWSALALVRSRRRLHALRECEGDACGWLFVDTSRNHLRRWCEMRTCGGAAKARAFRARQRGE
ncbi:CGNR zinc finger domain-containing protein [Pendulispora brunnea]|uniref:CGNR zinc finger domain-containing protein n=1 Tax=Pendulispora brunnea TaxID=2905690 RepID=A0ABZ2KBE5_9BACT